MKELEQKTIWTPGWDERKEGYGTRDMHIEFCLIGNLGGVSFNVSTKMYPLHLHCEWRGLVDLPRSSPSCPFLGYHSPIRLSESDVENQDCTLLGSQGCYCRDVGHSSGDRVLGVFLSDGIDAMWKELEKLYETLICTPIVRAKAEQSGVGL